MSEPTNRNGYPLAEDLRETMASALGLDVDEGWFAIATLLWEQTVLDGTGTRTWSLPAEPGPEVTAVRCDPHPWPDDIPGRDGGCPGLLWPRHCGPDGWGVVGQHSWRSLIGAHPHLTDATGEPR